MGIQERKAAIELLAAIVQSIDERVKRHSVAEEASSPTTSTRLTIDLIAIRDKIALVTGELLEPTTALHVSRVLDRITHADYANHPHNLKELVELGKKLSGIVSDLRVIANRKEFEGLS
ncbi:MAG: hypothetical protein ACTHXA_08455 [Gulosibacter sp.]|uniref:hypothetical protein n=1 Tax=Gulosibacter sp. TaxID=2817531 RepID=UPI003F93F141